MKEKPADVIRGPHGDLCRFPTQQPCTAIRSPDTEQHHVIQAAVKRLRHKSYTNLQRLRGRVLMPYPSDDIRTTQAPLRLNCPVRAHPNGSVPRLAERARLDADRPGSSLGPGSGFHFRCGTRQERAPACNRFEILAIAFEMTIPQLFRSV